MLCGHPEDALDALLVGGPYTKNPTRIHPPKNGLLESGQRVVAQTFIARGFAELDLESAGYEYWFNHET